MDWDGIFAIALALALIALDWKLNRHYERSGKIFAIPFSIYRERTPTFFRLTMFLHWLVFAFVTLFGLALTAALVSSWMS